MNDAKLRALIDGMVLEVTDIEDGAQRMELARRALSYVKRLRSEEPRLSKAELEKVLQAVLIGVLGRLRQISEGGGQTGTA